MYESDCTLKNIDGMFQLNWVAIKGSSSKISDHFDETKTHMGFISQIILIARRPYFKWREALSPTDNPFRPLERIRTLSPLKICEKYNLINNWRFPGGKICPLSQLAYCDHFSTKWFEIWVMVEFVTLWSLWIRILSQSIFSYNLKSITKVVARIARKAIISTFTSNLCSLNFNRFLYLDFLLKYFRRAPFQ